MINTSRDYVRKPAISSSISRDKSMFKNNRYSAKVKSHLQSQDSQHYPFKKNQTLNRRKTSLFWSKVVLCLRILIRILLLIWEKMKHCQKDQYPVSHRSPTLLQDRQRKLFNKIVKNKHLFLPLCIFLSEERERKLRKKGKKGCSV